MVTDTDRLNWLEASNSRCVEYWNDDAGWMAYDYENRALNGKGKTAREAIDAAISVPLIPVGTTESVESEFQENKSGSAAAVAASTEEEEGA